MKRIQALTLFLLIAACAAVAQDSDAATTIQNDIVEWQSAKESRSDELRSLYIQARRDAWSVAEYGARLEAVAAGETQVLAKIRSALGALGDMFRENPPTTGSATMREAKEWLTQVASALSVDNTPVSKLLEEVQSQGQKITDRAADSFVAAVGLPLSPGFGAASSRDQLSQIVDLWWLLFLCAPDDGYRSQMLVDLAPAIRLVSADLAQQSTLLATSYRTTERQVAQIHRAVAEALPWLTAESVAALSQTPGQAPEDPWVVALFVQLHQAPRADLVTAAVANSTTAFAIERVERLLAELSDRQAYEIGRAAGIGLAQVRALGWTLYRVRLDLAESAIAVAHARSQAATERYRQSDGYGDQVDLLRGYKDEGEGYLSGISPWVSGTQPRSGDSYRWAMLSVLSNRYAQYILLGDTVSGDSGSGQQDIEEAQRLVGAFASDLYAGMMQRLPDEVAVRLWRETAGDLALSYDRNYSLSLDDGTGGVDGPGAAEVDADRDLELAYDSFVSEAQGVDELRSALSTSAGIETGMNSDWSHAHGLHITVTGPDVMPSNAALAWFDLANRTAVEMQSFGHAVRGVFALQAALQAALDPALRSAGNPQLNLYDSRLAIAVEHLASAGRFEQSPGETLAVLYGLYPEVDRISRLIEALEVSADAAGSRLAHLEGEDRRTIQRAAGVDQ